MTPETHQDLNQVHHVSTTLHVYSVEWARLREHRESRTDSLSNPAHITCLQRAPDDTRNPCERQIIRSEDLAPAIKEIDMVQQECK